MRRLLRILKQRPRILQTRPRWLAASARLLVEELESRVTPAGGTWTALSNLGGGGTMMLLTDGSVMLQGGGIASSWSRLTPSSTGSYVNGTFSNLASMRLSRLYFASNVLTDGRVFVYGGEYSNGSQNWANSGEIYYPLANTWTTLPSIPWISSFGDDPSELLPDGTVLCGYLSGPQTYVYNPTTDRWSQGPTKLYGDGSDEETWVKLSDGSILSYDIFGNAQHAQKLDPTTMTWVDAGAVPVALSSSAVGSELGPGLLLPDGRVFLIGATGHTALYSSSTNTWTAGPDIPNNKGADDAPAAVLPNGDVIFAADTPLFNGPTQLFEFNPSANTITQLTLPSALTNALGGASYPTRMLVLPSGQVLLSTGSGQLWAFTPNGSAQASWAPTISKIAQNSDGSYTLTGTQLNGLSEGASYGDDAEMSSNYPIVELVNSSGHVYWGRTYNWSSTGVATGSAVETTNFTLPVGLPNGTYSLYVVANGISSAAFSFSTFPTAPTGVNAAPADGQVTLTWNASSGASTYNVYRGTGSGQEALYQIGVTGTSFVDSGLIDGTTYYYEVTAVSAGGEECGPSSEVSATPDPPPTVDTPASANPNPVSGLSTDLSVAGHNNIGETLTYSWIATTASSGANPQYSDNNSPTANNTTVTFNEAGTYTFQVTLSDADRLTATSSVTVVVNQTETSISVSPSPVTVNDATTQQFSASALDQFDNAMANQPAITWSVNAGGAGGTINTTGLYTAPPIGGPSIQDIVTATDTAANLSGSATVSIHATPPTVATAAKANPNPVPGNTTNLSVLGADAAGEASLIYSWTASKVPSGAANPTYTFGSGISNGTNGAKNATATVYQSGAYTFQVTIANPSGLTVTSSVNVTVNQTLTSIGISPATVTLPDKGQQQFAATGFDQFGNKMASQPPFTWSLASGSVGQINNSGNYTGPNSGTGNATVQATSGSVTGKATVIIKYFPPVVTQQASSNQNPVTGTQTSLQVQASDPNGANLTYSWTVTSQPAGAKTPGFNNPASNNTNVTFYQSGSYTFTVTISDSVGQSNTSSVTVSVVQTLTGISVTPANVTLAEQATQQFAPTAVDQFGQAMASQPSFSWQVNGGGGTITSSGLYTAPSSTGNFQVKVSGGGKNGQANVNVTTIPAAPSKLTAQASLQNGSAQVKLQWNNNSNNQTGVVVERSADGGTTWTPIVALTGNPTSYSDTTVGRGTTYAYRVHAYNALGNSGYSNVATVTTP
jgi:hypothetical protein